MTLIALTLFAYLLGTFPSAVIVARASGIDITKTGSGNPGASNVSRTLGWRRDVLVFVLDAAKGAVAAGLGLGVHGRPAAYACIAAATLGHMFPATRGFKGGKGVATVGGAMFVVQPVLATMLLVVWFLVSRVSGKASLASLAIIVLLPLGVALRGAPWWEVAAIVGLAILVLSRHLDNIKRLIRNEELSLGSDQGKNR